MGLFDDIPADSVKQGNVGLFNDIPTDEPQAGQPLDFLSTDSPPAQMTGQLPAAQPLRAPEMLPTPGFGGQVRQALSETYSVDPQQFSDARDVVLHPFDLARPSSNPTWIDKALGGAQNATIDTTAGTFTDPIALGAMATGLGPVQKILGTAAPLVGRAITGYFAGSMAAGTPEVYRNVRDAFATGDTEQISKAVTGAAMHVAMLLGVGKHALRGGVKGVQEEWAAAMSKRPDFQEAVKAEAMKQPVAVDQPSQTGVPALDEVNAQLAAKNAVPPAPIETPPAPVEPTPAPVETLAQEAVRLGVDPARWAKLPEDYRVFQRPQLAEQQASRAQRAAEKQQAQDKTAAEKAVWPKPNVAIPPPTPVAPTVPILFTPHVTPPPTKEPDKSIPAPLPVKPVEQPAAIEANVNATPWLNKNGGASERLKELVKGGKRLEEAKAIIVQESQRPAAVEAKPVEPVPVLPQPAVAPEPTATKPVGAENAQTAAQQYSELANQKSEGLNAKQRADKQSKLKSLMTQAFEEKTGLKFGQQVKMKDGTIGTLTDGRAGLDGWPDVVTVDNANRPLSDIDIEGTINDITKSIYESKNQSMSSLPTDNELSPRIRPIQTSRGSARIGTSDQQSQQGNAVEEGISNTGRKPAGRPDNIQQTDLQSQTRNVEERVASTGEVRTGAWATHEGKPLVEPPAKPVVKDSLTPEQTAKPAAAQPATKEQALATIDANDNRIAQLQRDQSAAKSAKKKASIQAQIETLAQESDALASQHDITFKTPPTEAPAAVPVEAPTVKSATEEMAAVKSTRKTRWTKTAESINPMGDLTKEVGAGIPNPVTVAKAALQVGKNVKAAVGPFAKEVVGEQFRINRVTDQRRSVLKWSGTMQKAYDEASQAKRDITEAVPDPVKREGITNWIQAGGDRAVLQDRVNRTADPKLKAGYEAALNLTPEELSMAQEVRDTFDKMEQFGRANDVLNAHRDNYVPQIWDMGKGPAVASSRMLRDKFKFAKERKLDSFFEGEQAGYVPKTKDISDLVPIYTHEMNSVIAAKQLVRDLSAGTASDGRPLVSVRGGGVPVSNVEYMVVNDTTGRTVRKFDTQAEADAAVGAGQSVQERLNQATLVLPKMPAKDTMDYTTMEKQPALQGWKYTTADSAGNPVLVKGDIALHPEAARQLKAVLGRSDIKNWYDTRTTASAEFLKKPVHFVDWAQSETKKTMLGLLAPFHQVQEGTHAIGHRVNPFAVTKGGFVESKTGLSAPEGFSIPKIDLVNDPAQSDAATHGLMLQPDRASANQFMEGFKQSGLVKRIPYIGPLADRYQTYLFHQYIPGLKFKTWTAMVERNSKVYAKELAAGQVTPEDIKVLSSEQANAAYGHMNYADLGRSPTIQHILQLGLLAPDFLEARGRFTLQAVKGIPAKSGREQMWAVAFLAATQAAFAYTAAKLTGGEWDPKDPFVMHIGARKYTARSVPEDFLRAVQDPRSFIMSRINPTLGKALVQGVITGRDYRGQKISTAETAKEILTAPLPLNVRPWMDKIPDSVREATGLRYLLPDKTAGKITPLEQMAGTLGLKVSRYYPGQKIGDLHREWMANNTDPKIRASYDEMQKATFPVSRYKVLDSALDDRNEEQVKTAIKQLEADGITRKLIRQRMNPWTGGDYPAPKPLFHEKAEYERKFVAGLTADQKVIYDAAKKDRLDKWNLFLKVSNQK